MLDPLSRAASAYILLSALNLLICSVLALVTAPRAFLPAFSAYWIAFGAARPIRIAMAAWLAQFIS